MHSKHTHVHFHSSYACAGEQYVMLSSYNPGGHGRQAGLRSWQCRCNGVTVRGMQMHVLC
eukprot:355846-Chlamydomonas_euryale.AAC.5